MKGEKYLTKSKQYALVYNEGSSWVSNIIVIKILPNGLDLSRYGFSVSKRVGNAVIRNKVKRSLREILRNLPLNVGWDVVFIARPSVALVRYAELKEVIENLLSKAQLLVKNYEKSSLETN
ncbi:MAG: ribonuclease P protein component [Dehalococcoidales bacterium]|nr:ribonuclease P protein component [Dehalococcoidales bacterium]